MRIISLDRFRELPAGTIYCKYAPQYFGELEIKGDTLDSDFVCAPLCGLVESESSNEMHYILDSAEKTGDSFKFDLDGYGRDGLYEDKQLFAIYETDDIVQLIEKLSKSLKQNNG